MPPSDRSAPERERVEPRSRTGGLLALLSVAGLFALVMLASSLQGVPQFSALEGEPGNTFTLPPEPAPSSTPAPMESPQDSLFINILLSVVAVVIGALILTLIFFGLRMLVRLLAQLWRDRPLARQRAAEIDTSVPAGPVIDSEPDTDTIRRGIEEALRTIDERPVAGDAIIAAWVGLEETAADAGSARGVNETPSEFTRRIIGRRADITDAITTLLDLYERVRFGEHRADEDDRATAAGCLRDIEAGWR